MTIKREGSHIQRSSLLMTAKPHLLKKASTPMGETTIGLHPKKNLLSLKGQSRATPKPPLVKASSTP